MVKCHGMLTVFCRSDHTTKYSVIQLMTTKKNNIEDIKILG